MSAINNSINGKRYAKELDHLHLGTGLLKPNLQLDLPVDVGAVGVLSEGTFRAYLNTRDPPKGVPALPSDIPIKNLGLDGLEPETHHSKHMKIRDFRLSASGGPEEVTFEYSWSKTRAAFLVLRDWPEVRQINVEDRRFIDALKKNSPEWYRYVYDGYVIPGGKLYFVSKTMKSLRTWKTYLFQGCSSQSSFCLRGGDPTGTISVGGEIKLESKCSTSPLIYSFPRKGNASPGTVRDQPIFLELSAVKPKGWPRLTKRNPYATVKVGVDGENSQDITDQTAASSSDMDTSDPVGASMSPGSSSDSPMSDPEGSSSSSSSSDEGQEAPDMFDAVLDYILETADITVSWALTSHTDIYHLVQFYEGSIDALQSLIDKWKPPVTVDSDGFATIDFKSIVSSVSQDSHYTGTALPSFSDLHHQSILSGVSQDGHHAGPAAPTSFSGLQTWDITGYGNGTTLHIPAPFMPISTEEAGEGEAHLVPFSIGADDHLPSTSNPFPDRTGRYSCEQPGCSSTFTRASDRARHAEIHQHTRHACQFCDKTFSRKDQLKTHNRQTHGRG